MSDAVRQALAELLGATEDVMACRFRSEHFHDLSPEAARRRVAARKRLCLAREVARGVVDPEHGIWA